MSSKYRDSFQKVLKAPTTAIAFSVVCGFKPKHIIVQNLTTLSKLEWWEGIADGKALLTTASTGAVTKIATKGITVGDDAVYNVNSDDDGLITTVGSASANDGVGMGFLIGLDTTINILSNDLSIFAE